MQLFEMVDGCNFSCSSRAFFGLFPPGARLQSGRETPKSWFEDNREHLQSQSPESSGNSFSSWPFSRGRRLHLLRPSRFEAPVSTPTKTGTSQLFQTHKQTNDGMFARSFQPVAQQHVHSDNNADSDSSSVTHSEDEAHFHSNFSKMEKGTVNHCGRLHRRCKPGLKDISLMTSIFLNCVFLTVILYLLAYHDHLPLYAFPWYGEGQWWS